MKTKPLHLALLAATALPAAAQTNFVRQWQTRVTATQNAQPHWVTPLVLVTPRLEQEFRTDFVHQYTPERQEQWTYDNGKGLELIPERHTEILLNLPPFIDHHNGAKDGFGDLTFVAKGRIASRNEQHGNYIVTAFLAGSVPTGKNANGGCCAVVTPTLAMGKGWGNFDIETTAGGSLPVTNSAKLGHLIAWNTVAQYHVATHGVGRFLWPEVESNASFFKGGSNDGKIADYITPGLLFGRLPLAHNPSATPGRLGLTFGAGEQIAVTHFNTYNHAFILTARIPF